MASTDVTTNGHAETNGNTSDLSAAQKLMQKHEEAHQATIEDVPDEEDLKHGEEPASASVLESTDDTPAPGWVPPISAKAAGKQKEVPPPKENKSLDTQSHDLFPELGGAPKPKPVTTPIWTAKKPGSAPPVTNGKANGNATNGVSRGSPQTSGATTPISVRGGPQSMVIPGRHQQRVRFAPSQLLPRAQLKKPLPDILKEINKKSKANVQMTTGQEGNLFFTASGPEEAVRQALNDVAAQIGSKVRTFRKLSRTILIIV